MGKRMSKDARREQLLSIAEEIVRNEGADALTLITLAEKAGVTKPLTYEHFSNREGLLSELYKRCDEKLVSAMTLSIQVKTSSLKDAASIAASSYMDCVKICGSLYEAVISALLAYPEYNNIRVQIRDYFVKSYHKLFRPFVSIPNDELRIKLIAIFGALEEIGKAMNHGEISYQKANDTLTSLIISFLGAR